MRLDVISEDKATLVCRSSGHEPSYFQVKTEGIEKWYPFNPNYEYRYSAIHDRLYINIIDEDAERLAYGVTRKKGRAHSNEVTMDMNKKHYVPEVYEDNRRVIEYAKSLGIATLNTSYTMEDVKQGYMVVGDKITETKQLLLNRMLDHFDITEAEFLKVSWEEQSRALYEHAKDEELAELAKLGEVLTMLGVMRKIATKK